MSDTPSWEPPPSPSVLPVTAQPRSGGRVGVVRVLAAVVAVVAVGAAAVFAVSQLRDSQGGAASPEELGEQILDAIEGEDILGMIDVLLPSERDVFREPMIELVSELTRIEVLGESASLSGIDGVDVRLEARSVQVRGTTADDIATVVLRADLETVVVGQRLPIGDLILDAVNGDELAELDTRETTPMELELTAVSIDGRWYLSLFFTLAETIRNDLDPVPDIPISGVEAVGGSTPEAAIDALLGGVEALDLGRIIGALNPGEAAALQRYAPLFLEDLQRELDQAPLRWRITEAEYTVSGSGDRRTASIDVVTIEGEADGDQFQIEYLDGCLRLVSGNERLDTCEGLGDQPTLDEILGDSQSARDLAEVLGDPFAEYQQPGLVLQRTDGQWFVSPIGTAFEQLLSVLRVLDRATIDALIETGASAVEEIFGQVFDGAFGDPFDDWIEVEDDSFWDDWDEGDAFGEDLEFQRCFEAFDADDAVDCFASGIAAGAIDPLDVPAEFLHPECGASEARWFGYYQLDDGEFMAVADAASGCFAELVAQGQLDAWQVPLGFDRVECFEGRNWYSVFDDPEYEERFLGCVFD